MKKKYRKLTFGTYDIRKDEVRIHPVLINKSIPEAVIEFVIFHELLHYQDRKELLERKNSGFFHKSVSFKVHGIHFHRREKGYPGKEKASKIMKELAEGTFDY